MSNWVQCYRLTRRSHRLEAKRADGGEPYGYQGMLKAEKGKWLCRNPENGYCWVMTDEGFDELYCEVGKPPPEKKKKKQEDGHRKGKSRHMSASSLGDDSVWGDLFSECEEIEDGEVEGTEGDVV